MKNNIGIYSLFHAGRLLISSFCLMITIVLLQVETTALSASQSVDADHKIIHAPRKIKSVAGSFKLNRDTQLLINSDMAMGAAKYFQKFVIHATGYQLRIQKVTSPQENAIHLFISDGFSSPEAYDLSVLSDKIIIRAASNKGLFYGLQSLRQMLPPEIESTYPFNDINWVIPGTLIKDSPEYPFRGMHLDVSRHFLYVFNQHFDFQL